MPTVALPQPTRMRRSGAPSTIGAAPAWTMTACPPSMVISTASAPHSFSSVSQVTTPSFFEPPVRWRTPPIDSICEPYSAVVTWPTCSPFTRTAAASAPRWRSVSIFTFTPQ